MCRLVQRSADSVSWKDKVGEETVLMMRDIERKECVKRAWYVSESVKKVIWCNACGIGHYSGSRWCWGREKRMIAISSVWYWGRDCKVSKLELIQITCLGGWSQQSPVRKVWTKSEMLIKPWLRILVKTDRWIWVKTAWRFQQGGCPHQSKEHLVELKKLHGKPVFS